MAIPAFAFEVLQDPQSQGEQDSLNYYTLVYLHHPVRGAFHRKMGHYAISKYTWADVLSWLRSNLNISWVLHPMELLGIFCIDQILCQDLSAAYGRVVRVILNNMWQHLPLCLLYDLYVYMDAPSKQIKIEINVIVPTLFRPRVVQ